MPDSDKRAVISFTVGMDEVPSRISGLLREAHQSCCVILEGIEEAASGLDTHRDIQGAYNSVDALRRKMMTLDLRLEDCQELLTSFQAAVLETILPDPSPQNEKGDEQETVIKENE